MSSQLTRQCLVTEIQKRLVNNANMHGYWWESADCNRRTGASDCATTLLSAKDGPLTKGSEYPGVFGLHTENINIALLGVTGPPLRVNYRPGRIMPVDFNAFRVAWEQEPGLILYQVLDGKGLQTFLREEHQSDPRVDLFAFGVQPMGSSYRLADYGTALAGCFCFPVRTQVATAGGSVPIASLHIGDKILAEDPKTGKVRPESVLAVIDDGVKPLIAVDLSDGSQLRVTSNHPFWVDSGARLDHQGWVQAGQLQPGDRLRTANGKRLSVLGIRWNVGDAHVYTLTVARDHDFFAGAAHVLVHNAQGGNCLSSFDRDAAIAEARAAQAELGNVPSGKAVAATARGQRTLSGWARVKGFEQSTGEVLMRAGNIGFEFPPDFRDQGILGRFQASHAETQMTEVAPNQPLAVSKNMCVVCNAYFSKLSTVTDEPQVVLDPSVGRIFYPDGAIETFEAER